MEGFVYVSVFGRDGWLGSGYLCSPDSSPTTWVQNDEKLTPLQKFCSVLLNGGKGGLANAALPLFFQLETLGAFARFQVQEIVHQAVKFTGLVQHGKVP